MQRLLLCLLLLVPLTGCDSHDPGPDAGSDAGDTADAGSDGGADGGLDFTALQRCSLTPSTIQTDEALFRTHPVVVRAWGGRPTDVWAVRKSPFKAAGLYRWDGTAWTQWTVPPASGLPLAIAGSSSEDVWFGGPMGQFLHWDGSTLSAVEGPTGSPISDIQARSPTEAWALSSTAGGTLLRWDGHTWSEAATFPLAGLEPSDRVTAFWVAGPQDVWLASTRALYRWHEGVVERVLTEEGPPALWGSGPDDVWMARSSGLKHWNGSALEPVPGSPREVKHIWGSGPQDIWFTGFVHWDGTRFVSHKEPSTDSLYWSSVKGTGPQDVWISAAGQLLHWDGQTWTIVSKGESFHVRDGLEEQRTSLWWVGPNDLWTYEATFDRVHHWNGQVLARVPETGEERAIYAHLNDVWASSPTDAWVVGDSGAAAHFDGTKWAEVSTGTTETLWGVHGTGAEDVWAVGQRGTVLHWDGRAWTPVDAGTLDNLTDVWVGPEGYVVAVGSTGTVVQRWKGQWTTLSGASGALMNVWGRAPGDVWLTGLDAVYHSDGRSVSVDESSVGLRTYGSALWELGPDSLIANGRWKHGGQWRNVPFFEVSDPHAVWVSPGGSVWLGDTRSQRLSFQDYVAHTSGNCLFVEPVYGLSMTSTRPAPYLAPKALYGAGEKDVWYVARYGRIFHLRR